MARPESVDRVDGGLVHPFFHPIPAALRKAKNAPTPRHPPSPNDNVLTSRNSHQQLDKDQITNILITETRKMFPRLHVKTTIVPAVHFSRVTYSDIVIEGRPMHIVQPCDRLSDARFDECIRRFRDVVTSLCERLSDEDKVMTVLFSLCFDNYLNCGGKKSASSRRKRKNSDSSQERQGRQPPHQRVDNGRTASVHNGDASPVRQPPHKTVENVHAPRQQNGDTSPMRQPSQLPQPVHNGHTPRQQNRNTTNVRQPSNQKVDNEHTPRQQNGHSQGASLQDASTHEVLHSTPPSLDELDMSVFPRPRDRGRRGEFDMLLIHRTLGFVVCEIKSLGDAFDLPGAVSSESHKRSVVCRKLLKALEQLDSNENMLRHLVSDLSTDDVIPVSKVLALPNMKKSVVRAVVLREPELAESFCRTFRTTSVEAALSKCIFAEHIPPTGYTVTPHDDVISELIRDWWTKLTSSCGNFAMSDRLYETLVARFCGPATLQLVTSSQTSRGQVSTLAQGVQETARCLTSPVLTQQQVDVLGMTSARLLLQGPPGTGKSQLLTLKALQWLRQGQRVIIISPWTSSHALAYRIDHQIRQEVTSQQAGRLHLVQDRKGDMEDVIQTLLTLRSASDTAAAVPGSTEDSSCQRPEAPSSSLDSGIGDDDDDDDVTLWGKVRRDELHDNLGDPPAGHRWHVLVPEAPWFLDKLLLVLHAVLGPEDFVLWASSSSTSSFCPPSPSPSLRDLDVIEMTHNLRRPPNVVREMMTSPAYSAFRRPPYTSQDAGVLSSMPHLTDGPPVKRLEHVNHGDTEVVDCEQCGHQVATFLTQDLHIGHTRTQASAGREDPGNSLVFSDVLVSGHLGQMFSLKTAKDTSTEDGSAPMEVQDSSRQCVISPVTSSSSTSIKTPGFLKGLQQEGVRFDIMAEGDVNSYRKLAVAEDDDVVQVSPPELLKGVERKVVVVLAPRDLPTSVPHYLDPAYDVMACCTSQLVIVGDAESRLEERLRRVVSFSLERGNDADRLQAAVPRALSMESLPDCQWNDLRISNASDTDSLDSLSSSEFSLS